MKSTTKLQFRTKLITEMTLKLVDKFYILVRCNGLWNTMQIHHLFKEKKYLTKAILVCGNPNTKFMDRSNQIFFRTCNNMYKPIFLCMPLAFLKNPTPLHNLAYIFIQLRPIISLFDQHLGLISINMFVL